MFEERFHVSNHPRNASQNNRAITVLEQWNVKACYHEVLVRTWAARYTAGGCSWNGHSRIRQAGRSHRTWMSTWDPAARQLHIHPMENLTRVRRMVPAALFLKVGSVIPNHLVGKTKYSRKRYSISTKWSQRREKQCFPIHFVRLG